MLSRYQAPLHDNLKRAMVDYGETDTTLAMRSLRNTERVLRTETAEKVIEIESTGTATIADIAQYVSGKRGYEEVLKKGNVQEGVMAAGQVMGLIHDIPTVKELIDRIMAEAEDIITTRLAGINT